MRQRVYIWIAVGIALLLLFGSCRSIRYVPVETIRTDSLYLTMHERDSIYIKDSVHIKEKGDSVFVDKWHIVYRDRMIRRYSLYREGERVRSPLPCGEGINMVAEDEIRTRRVFNRYYINIINRSHWAGKEERRCKMK